jgi:hypothetical protein
MRSSPRAVSTKAFLSSRATGTSVRLPRLQISILYLGPGHTDLDLVPTGQDSRLAKHEISAVGVLGSRISISAREQPKCENFSCNLRGLANSCEVRNYMALSVAETKWLHTSYFAKDFSRHKKGQRQSSLRLNHAQQNVGWARLACH